MENKFAEVAPEVFAVYKTDADRKDSPRHQRTGSRKIEASSDPSSFTVPASATLLGDADGVAGYLGISGSIFALLIGRTYIAVVISAGDTDICCPYPRSPSNPRISDTRLPPT
jgi:hypothetical protein